MSMMTFFLPLVIKLNRKMLEILRPIDDKKQKFFIELNSRTFIKQKSVSSRNRQNLQHRLLKLL